MSMEQQRVRSSHALSRARTSLRGLAAGWRRDRAIKELWFALGAGWMILLLVNPNPVWWAATLIASAVSLAIEHLNTAIEVLLDRLHPDAHPEIGSAKDLASGAALLCNLSVGLVIIGAALFG